MTTRSQTKKFRAAALSDGSATPSHSSSSARNASSRKVAVAPRKRMGRSFSTRGRKSGSQSTIERLQLQNTELKVKVKGLDLQRRQYRHPNPSLRAIDTMKDEKYSGLSFHQNKNSQATCESASSNSHHENRPPVSSSQDVEHQSLSTTRTPTLAASVSYKPIERQSLSAPWAQTSVASTYRSAYTSQSRTTSQFVSPPFNFQPPPARGTRYDNHSSSSFGLGRGSNNRTDGVNEWPHHDEASTSSSSRHMASSGPPFPASPAYTAPSHPLPCVPYRPTNNPQHVQFTQSANGSFQANSTRPPSNHGGSQTARTSFSSTPVIDDFWSTEFLRLSNNPTARPSSHSSNNEQYKWEMSEDSQGWASTGQSSTRPSNSSNNPTSWTARPSSQSSNNDWGSTSSSFFQASSKKHGSKQRRREKQWEKAREVYQSIQPEAEILTLADDRVPWIKPPVVANSRQGCWTRYQFEGTSFVEMRKGEEAEGDEYGLSKTYYDRHFLISVVTDTELTTPDGLTTDIGIFGLPCPDYPFMSRGYNGNLTAREKPPKWLYTTRDPPAGSVGREPPTPRIEALPHIGTPDPVTAAAQKEFLRQMDGSLFGSPCANTQPSGDCDEHVGMPVSPQLPSPHQPSADNLHGYHPGSPCANTQPSDDCDKHVGMPDQPSANSLPEISDAVAAASPDIAPQDKTVVDIPIAKGFCVSLPLNCDEVTPCGPPDDDDDDRISLGQDDSEWGSTYLARFRSPTIPPSDVEASNPFTTSGSDIVMTCSVVNCVDGGGVREPPLKKQRSISPGSSFPSSSSSALPPFEPLNLLGRVGSVGAPVVNENSGLYAVDSPLDEQHRWLKRGRRGAFFLFSPIPVFQRRSGLYLTSLGHSFPTLPGLSQPAISRYLHEAPLWFLPDLGAPFPLDCIYIDPILGSWVHGHGRHPHNISGANSITRQVQGQRRILKGSSKPKRKKDIIKHDVVLTTYSPGLENEEAKKVRRRRSLRKTLSCPTRMTTMVANLVGNVERKLTNSQFYCVILDEAQAIWNR
ncbi:hypothetical protein BDN72DRAFT_865511 [Pluteus cervinus]|uniref:Uncharacterized protein n=1 Tax=Pluteus cervinus TaxID=181527 RepID=A0ACD2ZZZ2_9AGAR|nr:hypothetical protein BDN72DRAFT_865511 [Pluteus cervinus]